MRLIVLLFFILSSSSLLAQSGANLGPNSGAYPKIPSGQLIQHTWHSSMYPNTVRDYFVYVPAQCDASVPAALMVFQDGHTYVKEEGDFRVPIVFDNLIAQEKMPVTIGLFINPGHDINMEVPDNPWRVSNRSIEYDTLSDRYVQFLEEELLAEIKKQYHIADDPSMHAICGISSGGICAFTAAWRRPDIFQKVLSHIGSFTDIKGGHNYPPMIRQTDKKPLKVLLQDGSKDLDNEFGNWWLANQQMAAALAFKNYEYKFMKDSGGHNGQYAGQVLPESLTWLWSDKVPERMASKVYRRPNLGVQNATMFSGETMHLSHLQCDAIEIKDSMSFFDSDHEQLFIVIDGQVSAAVDAKKQTLPNHSVIFLAQGDHLKISRRDTTSLVYHLSFAARQAQKEQTPSFTVSYEEVAFTEHSKGGVRKYFDTSTHMCGRFEMHMTTLKPGLKSHLPHTHKAEELIIMIHGKTEEEIGNARYQGRSGDIYYLGAHVPHAIKNIGEQPAMYFAFQWF
ncbi:MAG: cupin domain-containing protein [Saprospiraceae bacterium]|nr:cupin domain-containing protein [Saprospiraceae bacterium]